jgi:guanylate kinase
LKSGRLVIISGPSGVGKDTVIDAWSARNPRVARVVAYTTRIQRPHERDGIDYRFVDIDRFMQHVQTGDFLEYKEVHGNHYGTPLADMEDMLCKGQIAILKVDVQGALTVMPLRPDAISVFLLPPTNDELVRRLRKRGTETDAQVKRRMLNAMEEVAMAGRYQHRIVNDEVPNVVDQLERLVNA